MVLQSSLGGMANTYIHPALSGKYWIWFAKLVLGWANLGTKTNHRSRRILKSERRM